MEWQPSISAFEGDWPVYELWYRLFDSLSLDCASTCGAHFYPIRIGLGSCGLFRDRPCPPGLFLPPPVSDKEK